MMIKVKNKMKILMNNKFFNMFKQFLIKKITKMFNKINNLNNRNNLKQNHRKISKFLNK